VTALAEAAGARLESEGVDVVNLRRAGEAHAVSVALSTRDDRAFVTFDGVNLVLEERLLAWLDAHPAEARHLHLALGPRDLAAWRAAVERWRAAGATTSWDFGWHEELPDRRGFGALVAALDWIFVNDREARHYAGAATLARAMTRWAAMCRATIVKRGALGATAMIDGKVLDAVARQVRVVDTTGAGDAFNAGFLSAMLAGKPAAACLRAGVAVGTRSTTAAGGLDGLPRRRIPAANARWRRGR
jgi:sugar/nucleoside kinase (ribokinase family)